jgi:hypothetical protein
VKAVLVRRYSCLLRSVLLSVLLSMLLAGCASAPPRNTQDICAIFTEKSDWHEPATAASARWGSSIPVMMSIMYQESQFVADAQPKFRWFLFIPLGRPSSAYGFPQAKDETWDWYVDKSGNSFAERDEFEDAIDFIGWYNAQTIQRNRVRRNDAYNLYLAYHEGQGGYERGTWRSKPWLRNIAQRVASRAATYDRQYAHCRQRLVDADKNWF